MMTPAGYKYEGQIHYNPLLHAWRHVNGNLSNLLKKLFGRASLNYCKLQTSKKQTFSQDFRSIKF